MSTFTRLTRRADISLRQRMEDAVERLLAALDAMDGDCDDEPSLGSTTTYGDGITFYIAPAPGQIDAEGPDDTGIADFDGYVEQMGTSP